MAQTDTKSDIKFHYIPVDKLEVWRDVNVRTKDIEIDIEDLANNIREIGVQVPLLVKPKSGDKYWVISGQRRLLAARRAGLKEVPCLIREDISALDARIASFSENTYRLDMTADDKSDAAAFLLGKLKTKEAVAARLGVTVQTLHDYLGYRDVDPRIKTFVRQHKMNVDTALKIHRKFADREAAYEIAQTYAESPRKSKQKVFEAIRQAPKTANTSEVKTTLKRLGDMIPYKIFLPPVTSDIIKDLARQGGQKPEHVIAQIVEQWIDAFKQGTATL